MKKLSQLRGELAFRALSPLERDLVMELHFLAREFGTAEPILCSAYMAAKMCNVNRTFAWRALDGLRKKGFIERIKLGKPTRYGRLATQWKLTWLPYKGESPTFDYRKIHNKALGPNVDPAAPFVAPEMESAMPEDTTFPESKLSEDEMRKLLEIGARTSSSHISITPVKHGSANSSINSMVAPENHEISSAQNLPRCVSPVKQGSGPKLPWRKPIVIEITPDGRHLISPMKSNPDLARVLQ